MISLIKRLFHRIDTMNALNKIIDEMENDRKIYERNYKILRERYQKAEDKVIRQDVIIIDQNIEIARLKEQVKVTT